MRERERDRERAIILAILEVQVLEKEQDLWL